MPSFSLMGCFSYQLRGLPLMAHLWPACAKRASTARSTIVGSNWQLAESFERTRHLIAAINIVSVHAKLSLAGVPDPQPPEDVKNATSFLRAFLEKLAADLSQSDKDASSPVTGATARANLLAKRFALSRNQAPESSPIYARPLPQFIPLFASQTRPDQLALISGLQTLRNLLEQLHHADSSEMLGNL
jgi:hypothetical protein